MDEPTKYEGKIRLATKQYCFVEVKITDTLPNILKASDELEELHFPRGIPDKDLNMVVDKMLLGQAVEGGVELYERMSTSQRFATQTLKRALKRLKAKEGDLEDKE